MALNESPQNRSGLHVRIWGARGSVPTPERDKLGVGGNTSCVEVKLPSGESLIFDAGTGIRNLGFDLMRRSHKQHDLHLLLTHFHWDHLQGLPFFAPLYLAESTVTFHSGSPVEDLRQILGGQMVDPYFPMKFDLVAATMNFDQVTGEPSELGGALVSTFALHHPGGACGYRIDSGGRRVVYATDHEHGNDAADLRLRHAAKGADLLLYDSQFTPSEIESHRGWGHSTWLEATCVARDAGVKRLVLFHHDPGHNDAMMEAILAEARREFPNTDLAIEGAEFPVG
ncbi:MAG TPA: MBL fold metallo-hydrolase [Acidobacteriaceae bacterium]